MTKAEDVQRELDAEREQLASSVNNLRAAMKLPLLTGGALTAGLAALRLIRKR